MFLHRVLYVVALLLSIISLCVAADAAELSSGEVVDGGCTTDNSQTDTSKCPGNGKGDSGPPGKAGDAGPVGPSGPDGVTGEDTNDSQDTRVNQQNPTSGSSPAAHSSQRQSSGEPGKQGPSGQSGEGSNVSGRTEENQEVNKGIPPVTTVTPESSTSALTPDPNPSEGSVVESSDDGQTGGKGNNTTRESENGDNNGSAEPQPSADSPNTSATVSGDGSDNATPGNGTTPAESELTSNQEGVADNTETTPSTTTTTTTTTTLPPELTNNKKGDADSSNSISSSVWVRMPLLIVVTLACILVC
ncbi:uncharacterized protein TM35_000571180 [Trypanosoma theileri]|uniref:Uncharacterized protein n=1 Tax=Trypanosoma theileri TaxID=67003 RepID=A0A1X0NI80_9TRYP|nr:uncharacterized protein TM35_000571180 [Trypanosoma theileri]ORC83790.1 hypothetical protein TM35_000571180 [Trypanosoma theileri]